MKENVDRIVFWLRFDQDILSVCFISRIYKHTLPAIELEFIFSLFCPFSFDKLYSIQHSSSIAHHFFKFMRFFLYFFHVFDINKYHQNMKKVILIFLIISIFVSIVDSSKQKSEQDSILVLDIPDITHKNFVQHIARLLNVTYLGISNTSKYENKLDGIVWGIKGRPVINLPVRLLNTNCPKSLNVIFKVDIGSPISTLTKETLRQLYRKCNQNKSSESDWERVLINDRKIDISKSVGHFENLNILGTDFMKQYEMKIKIFYSQGSSRQKVEAYFNDRP